MDRDVRLAGAFRLRYSYERLQWLLTTISAMSLLTFSAQELWQRNVTGLCHHVEFSWFFVYAILFTVAILYVNMKDFRRICERRTTTIVCAVFSMIIDLTLLSSSEFFVLLIINQLSPDLLRSFLCILLIVLPLSLGELTLSSLTTEYLKKRAKKLRSELIDLRKGIRELEEKREDLRKKVEELERKRVKFKEAFYRERGGSRESNEQRK